MKKLKELALATLCAVGLGGCADMTEDEAIALNLFGIVAQGSPASSYQDKVIGAGMSSTAGMVHQRNVARTGRSRQTMNVNYGNNNARDTTGGSANLENQTNKVYYDDETGKRVTTWIAPPESFCFEDWKDKNGDGYMGRDELIGLGNYFDITDKERAIIYCASRWKNSKGKSILGKVIDQRSNEIVKVMEEYLDFPSKIISIGLPFLNTGDGIGQFRVEWYVNGQLDESKTTNFFVNEGRKPLVSKN